MKKLFLFLISLFFAFQLKSQVIENVRFEQSGDKVLILYDINKTETMQKFAVNLYYTTDGAAWMPLQKAVSGDVGDGISGGKAKRAVWDVKASFSECFTVSQIKFKVEAVFSANQQSVNASEISDKNGTFTDNRDNQMYKWAKIGSQIWMSQNLNYSGGDGTDCYDNSNQYCKEYGKLYTYEVAKDVCPTGWHLPSDAEWNKLETESGLAAAQAENAEWRGQHAANLKNNGSSGLNVIFGGYKSVSGKYKDAGNQAHFWTSTKYINNKAWKRSFDVSNSAVRRYWDNRHEAYSVRCVKD